MWLANPNHTESHGIGHCMEGRRIVDAFAAARSGSVPARRGAASWLQPHLPGERRIRPGPGRDRPGEKIIAFYEEEYRADGVLWSAYVAAKVPRFDEAPRGDEEPNPYPVEGDASEFVADVTIPDGTVMRPGHRFVKTWRVRNSGVVPWIDRRLGRVGPPLAHGLPRSVPSVPVPDTPPGQEVDISVPMRAQFLEGSAQVTWKMIDSAGRTYFPDRYPSGLVVCIVARGTPEP
jgi:Ig-like domain from next to BRCA1 gene